MCFNANTYICTVHNYLSRCVCTHTHIHTHAHTHTHTDTQQTRLHITHTHDRHTHTRQTHNTHTHDRHTTHTRQTHNTQAHDRHTTHTHDRHTTHTHYERILSFYHSIGSPIDGAHQVRRPIEIIWAVTVRRPLKRQRERKKVVPPGIEPRASGLSRQCSATKLRHPPTATSPRLSGSQCCDKSSRFFCNQKHTQQISPIYQHTHT